MPNITLFLPCTATTTAENARTHLLLNKATYCYLGQHSHTAAERAESRRSAARRKPSALHIEFRFLEKAEKALVASFVHGPGRQVLLAPLSGPGSTSHSGLVDPCNRPPRLRHKTRASATRLAPPRSQRSERETRRRTAISGNTALSTHQAVTVHGPQRSTRLVPQRRRTPRRNLEGARVFCLKAGFGRGFPAAHLLQGHDRDFLQHICCRDMTGISCSTFAAGDLLLFVDSRQLIDHAPLNYCNVCATHARFLRKGLVQRVFASAAAACASNRSRTGASWARHTACSLDSYLALRPARPSPYTLAAPPPPKVPHTAFAQPHRGGAALWVLAVHVTLLDGGKRPYTPHPTRALLALSQAVLAALYVLHAVLGDVWVFPFRSRRYYTPSSLPARASPRVGLSVLRFVPRPYLVWSVGIRGETSCGAFAAGNLRPNSCSTFTAGNVFFATRRSTSSHGTLARDNLPTRSTWSPSRLVAEPFPTFGIVFTFHWFRGFGK
ncbi:hypothetical protein K438DRAFT_2123760 [Mycena galopus ATCC 62051]|nr:hypothetical protein K438DRAFT_2123760 [Mycena galopus ATCC 62051]